MLHEEENRKQQHGLAPASCVATLEVPPSPAAPVGPVGRWHDSASGSGVGVYPDGSIRPCELAEESMAVINEGLWLRLPVTPTTYLLGGWLRRDSFPN